MAPLLRHVSQLGGLAGQIKCLRNRFRIGVVQSMRTDGRTSGFVIRWSTESARQPDAGRRHVSVGSSTHRPPGDTSNDITGLWYRDQAAPITSSRRRRVRPLLGSRHARGALDSLSLSSETCIARPSRRRRRWYSSAESRLARSQQEAERIRQPLKAHRFHSSLSRRRLARLSRPYSPRPPPVIGSDLCAFASPLARRALIRRLVSRAE
jgi:hypothetical protein